MTKRIAKTAEVLVSYTNVEQLNHTGYLQAIEDAGKKAGNENIGKLERAIHSVERRFAVGENSNPELLKENLRRIANYMTSHYPN